MVKSADKERVRTLLKDTITLLIRNGLEFKTKFSIEALIGVTLDEDDIILVSINELVKSDLAAAAIKEKPAGSPSQSDGESSDGSVNADRSRNGRRKKRKRRKAPDIKSEQDPPSQGNDDDELDVKRNKPDESAAPTTVHDEEDDEEDHYDDHDEEGSDDLVFVKQEMDSWAQNTSSQSVDHTDPSMNFPALGDASLVPMSAGDDMWTQDEPGTSYQQSSTMTSDTSMDPSTMQAAGFQPQDAGEEHCAETNPKIDEQGYLIKASKIDDSSDQKHVKSAKYACQFEGCSFTSTKFNVLRHFDMVHIQYTHPCEICGKSYKQKKNLDEHVRTVHENSPLVCEQCGQKFQTGVGYKMHVKYNHENTAYTFQCDVCKKGFHRKPSFEEHMRNHHLNEKYECNKCGKRFGRIFSLKTHQKHSCKGTPEEKKTVYSCSECNMTFTTKETKKIHVAIKHSEYHKTYMCHCGKKYDYRQSFQRHVKTCFNFT